MAHAGEQVVLNLKVQASDIPGKEPAVIGKIRGSMQLVYSPTVIHFSLRIREGIRRAINHVRRLKNNSEDESGYIMHDQEADEDLPPGHAENEGRDHENVRHIDGFRKDKHRPLSYNIGLLFFYKTILLIFDANSLAVLQNTPCPVSVSFSSTISSSDGQTRTVFLSLMKS